MAIAVSGIKQNSIGTQTTTGDIVCIQGIQGTQGDTGIQGTVGVQGIIGIQGIQGILGIQGITGIQGTQGLQGLQGKQGLQGNLGIQGSLGIQGIQGYNGSQGVQGFIGIQGFIGSGTQGLQGVQGFTGIQGSYGVQGYVGPSLQGIQGVQGLQGKSGYVDLQTTNNFTAKQIFSDGLYINGVVQEGSTNLILNSSTYVVNLSPGPLILLTLGINITVVVFPTPTIGCQFTLVITQDSVGSRTFAWPSDVRWANSTAPTLTTSPNRTDVISFIADGTYWLGFIGGFNYLRG